MSAAEAEKAVFLESVQASISASTFVKLTLGKPRPGAGIKKAVASLVTIRERPCLKIVISHATKDVTETIPIAEAVAALDALFGATFLSATLFTTAQDLALTYNKRGEPRLTKGKPTLTSLTSTGHDRSKQYAVDPARPYLAHLGITLDDGRVKPSMYAKFRQICHFIEITADLLRASPLHTQPALSVLEIGSGKGYLTFALYDFLIAHLNISAKVTGVEVRSDLVTFCSGLAARLDFNGLSFAAATAEQTRIAPTDLLIALHACDTATDDAIYHGIAAGAAIIVVAPCCQHELAPQLSNTGDALRGLMKFGLFKQRQADLVTDAARCLMLESQGYKVKVIEFVSTEHTAKNILIAATKSKDVDRAAARRQYDALKALTKFETHHLEARLAGLDAAEL